MGCPRTVPIEALHIDLSITPIIFVLIGRRIMFFWYILNKPQTELVRQIVDAMIAFPSGSDWINMVRSDLSFLDIQGSEIAFQIGNESVGKTED